MTTTFRLASPAQAQAFRISPTDGNYFALLFDGRRDAVGSVFVVEIFAPGGATPPNVHAGAHEFFYVLHGEGIARCGEAATPIAKGDALLLAPGNVHVIENTGAGKLYTLTVMTPDEGFADLIRSGEPVSLDEEDLRVLADTA